MMRADLARTRRAAVRASEVATDVPASEVSAAMTSGASAVSGGALGAALEEAGPEPARRLSAFAAGCEKWTSDLDAAVDAYDDADLTSRVTLGKLVGRPV
jgi:hypothetical protein